MYVCIVCIADSLKEALLYVYSNIYSTAKYYTSTAKYYTSTEQYYVCKLGLYLNTDRSVATAKEL